MAKVVQLLQKMGLVEIATPDETTTASTPAAPDRAAEQAAPAAPTATTRLAPPPDFAAAISDAKVEDPEVDFRPEDIYASAAITAPEHGFTIFKLIEMMRGEEFAELEPATAAKLIVGILRRLPTGAVDIKDIIADAVARDQALDAFENFLADRVDAAAREVATANRSLQEEIDELTRKNTALMEANQARVEAERSRMTRWRSRKQAEEDRLFNAVQPFVDTNPVSRSRDDQ